MAINKENVGTGPNIATVKKHHTMVQTASPAVGKNEQARDFQDVNERHIEYARTLIDEEKKRLTWSREQVLQFQTEKLGELIRYAKEKSPFHGERLANVETSNLDASDLTSLPIMTKKDVMDNWDDVVTDQRLKLVDVQEHLDDLLKGRKENPYVVVSGKDTDSGTKRQVRPEDTYTFFATGGTSGRRGVFVWDWEQTAVAAAYLNAAEEKICATLPPSTAPKRSAFIVSGSFVHVSRFLCPMIGMMDPEREILMIAGDTPIKDIVKQLNEYKPDRILGYSSLIEELAHRSIKEELCIHPQYISAGAEPVEDSAREAALKAWGVNIHDVYGSTEGGMMSFEGPQFDGSNLAETNLIFEVVNEQYEPVPDGEKGDKLLITKLSGWTMPLIRFEMSDMLCLSPDRGEFVPGVRRIKKIDGRSDVRFAYSSDVVVHPIAFRHILGQQRSIMEYQVQQTPQGADVLVIAVDEVDVDYVKKELTSALETNGLTDPEVTVSVVESLPRHPETNKLRRFVPLGTA